MTDSTLARDHHIAHHRIRRLRWMSILAILALLGTLEAATVWADPTANSKTSGDGASADSLLAQVEAADRSLNQAAAERERERFHALLDTDTVFLAGELYRGRLAVASIWENLFVGKYDFRYEGETLHTVAAASGEFGWSIGSSRTTFQRPGLPNPEVSEGHYLHLWEPGEKEGAWELLYNASLVVHPTLGEGRDPRSGLMTAWPELADQVNAVTEIRWSPEVSVRAESGDVAYVFGTYEASFLPSAKGAQEGRAVDAEEGTESLGDPTITNEESTEGSDADTVADSGEGEAEPAVTPISGQGHYLAVWQKDPKGRWQLAGEGYTPPGIYGGQ